MPEKDDEHYMNIALGLAREAFMQGEVPIGALIIRDGKILAQNYNRREELKDATAHAEILVLREAGRLLGGWRLLETTLYVTLEPCPMCAGALVQARVSRLVYGAKDPKGGAVESLYNITSDPRLNHRLEIRGGVLKEKCSALLQNFFKNRR
ncbi:MAG: tRNA adenosine(34) deaminase TadA [Firmicutes bacterium]|nr:tRNA adenosine(34) deaminase TadA [Bacillota bacterium]